MSKIGDLIVRLLMEDGQYNKTIKKADKETQSFGARMKKIGVTGAAAWAAISAAAVKVVHDVINASQRLGDRWQMMTTKMQAGWQEFIRSIGNWSFDSFLSRLNEAVKSAEKLQSARDALFEDDNASKILKAQRATELAGLEEIYRDTSKSDQDRIDALKKYISIMEDILRIPEASFSNLFGAEADRFLATTRIGGGEQGRKMLMDFLGAYNQTNSEFMEAIGWLRDNLSSDGWTGNDISKARVGGNYSLIGESEWIRQYSATMATVQKQLQSLGYAGTPMETLYFADIGRTYERERNDDDVNAVVDAYTKWQEARTALWDENKRAVTLLNTLSGKAKQSQAELENKVETPSSDEIMQEGLLNIGDIVDVDALLSELQDQVDSMAEAITLPDIDTSALDKYDERLDTFIQEYQQRQEMMKAINDGLKDSIITAYSDGLQAATDALFGLQDMDTSQVLASMLKPFANYAKSIGAMLVSYGIAMTAFKKTMLNPTGAIVAGAALIAIGAAMSSAISSFTSSGASSTATSTAYAGSSTSYGDSQGMEITVNVKGKISGSDIVISGQRTIDKWKR